MFIFAVNQFLFLFLFFFSKGHPSVFEVSRIAARCGMCLIGIAKQASHLFVVEVLQLIKSWRQFRVACCARLGPSNKDV